MLRLDYALQRYAWGSPSAIPQLLGLAQDDRPLAELWWGANRVASATVAHGEGDRGVSLREVIARDPLGATGDAQATDLPYMLKLLGVASPLSLQVHPPAEQARAGYAREEAAGIKLTASNRSYKDPNVKPEMAYALTSFEALVGLRRPEDIRALLAPLVADSALARAMATALATPGREGLKAGLTQVLVGDQATPNGVDQLVAACRRQLCLGAGEPGVYSLAVALAKRFPGDRGVAATLMMSHISLAPGEALFVPPGTLHAYLRGLAVELMGPSDDVLRAGLTQKYTDPERVLTSLDLTARSSVKPTVVRDGPARVLRPPTRAFQLADVRVAGPYSCPFTGPRIAVALEGQVTGFTNRGSLHLSQGQSLFAMASEGPLELRGKGRVIVAGPGRN